MGLLAVLLASASLGLVPPSDHAELTLVPPDGWLEGDAIARPDLSQTPQSRLSEWRVWQASTRGPALVAACFETPTEAWAQEAEPLALDKMTQFATTTATRAASPGAYAARTFLAFVRTDEGHILTSCFAMCTDEADAPCANALLTARVRGPVVEAPRPTFGVRLLLSAVHHPARAAGVFGGIVCLGFAAAILTRKRPRRRPSS